MDPLLEDGRVAYLPLSVPNGFHEKVSLVKVNVVTEAETKAAKRTPLATLPFALSLNLLFGGSVHDGFRPGRALQSKVRPLSRLEPFGEVTATTGPRAFSRCVRRCFVHLGVGSFLRTIPTPLPQPLHRTQRAPQAARSLGRRELYSGS
jgi:hypothetical protein